MFMDIYTYILIYICICMHLRAHCFAIIHAPALTLPSASSGAFGPYGEFKGKGLMS